MSGNYVDYFDTFNFHSAAKNYDALGLIFSLILKWVSKLKPRQKKINENSKWGNEIIVTKSINPKTKSQVPK
jgi:membrane protein CcdC involved in cytochrome C biogenesis